MKFADDEPPDEEPVQDAEKVAEAIDAPAMEPSSVRKRGMKRGIYGLRLGKKDRATLIAAIRGGATDTAAAQLIGRSRASIAGWRMLGAEGKPGYARLYYEMETARGHALTHLHLFANQKATEPSADGRLAVALLDRNDPEFRELRASRRTEVSTEIVAAAGVSAGGAASVGARVTYSLSWDDGAPIRVPGLVGAPLFRAIEPGGNGNGDGHDAIETSAAKDGPGDKGEDPEDDDS